MIYSQKTVLPTPEEDLPELAERSILEANAFLDVFNKFKNKETKEHEEFIKECKQLYSKEETKQQAIDKYLSRYESTPEEAAKVLSGMYSFNDFIKNWQQITSQPTYPPQQIGHLQPYPLEISYGGIGSLQQTISDGINPAYLNPILPAAVVAQPTLQIEEPITTSDTTED